MQSQTSKITLAIVIAVIIGGGSVYIWRTLQQGKEDAKNCNLYEMPMTEKEAEECTCPEGYRKSNRFKGAYCATDSQIPCGAHTDCPESERCISRDGRRWFCTGIGAGCYFNDPEEPEAQICVD